MPGWLDISKTNKNGQSGNIEDMKIQNETLHWRHAATVVNWIVARTEIDFAILTDKWMSTFQGPDIGLVEHYAKVLGVQ